MVCGFARAQNNAINQNPILKNRSSFLTLSPWPENPARGIWPPGLPVAFFGMMSIPGFRDPR